MGSPDISVVIPCRNEEDTVVSVLKEVESVLGSMGLRHEIILADNNSTDQSADLASGTSARIVSIETPGYGSALAGGIAEAQGTYVFLADADGSYDFSSCPAMLKRLQEGDHLVLGCRFPRWGGTIQAGAMPWLHHWIGNPLLSWLVRRLFPVRVHDIYCGLRGFSREHYEQLMISSTGMRFATEMVIKFSLAGFAVSELPVTLRCDGRISTSSHLRTFRDGWSTLVLILRYARQSRTGTLAVRLDDAG